MTLLIAVFVTARDGEGVIFGQIDNQSLKGADLFGSKFDGTLSDDGKRTHLSLQVDMPGGVHSILGFTAPPEGLSYRIESDLPASFLHEPFVRIETPFGAINARFQKLREL